MKHIVLFGAGKSATVLIDFLKNLAEEKSWLITIADNDADTVKAKAGRQTGVKAIALNIENEEKRRDLVKQADLVISMLPPFLHYFVALDCLEYGRHLLTASYIDENIKKLAPQIADKNVLFLCEMGLDPGIDHMSAMRIIDSVKSQGGKIVSFKSHCGGLVAPESDNNPWHYKISWNPRNIILAGKGGAVFKDSGNVKKLSYQELFSKNNLVTCMGETWAWYANRDSLSYIPLYQLEEAETFVRTTLRHPDFCFGWKNIIDLNLTNEESQYDTDGLTMSAFFKLHFDKYGFSEWLNQMLITRLSHAKNVMQDWLAQIENEDLEESGNATAENISLMSINEKGELDLTDNDEETLSSADELALKLHEANLSLKQLFFLGLDSDEEINKGVCSAADILQFIVEKRLALEKEDKDMIVMIHELEYDIDGKKTYLSSYLSVKGENNLRTAMAKTVGLPLGIAAKLILEGKITTTGLHIPILPEIYNPVLDELNNYGINFTDTKQC